MFVHPKLQPLNNTTLTNATLIHKEGLTVPLRPPSLSVATTVPTGVPTGALSDTDRTYPSGIENLGVLSLVSLTVTVTLTTAS